MRYCDPWSVNPVADQWELYNLDADPTEMHNLLVYNGEFPKVNPVQSMLDGLDMTPQQLEQKARELGLELAAKEAELLSPYPSAYPTAGATIGL